MLACRTRRPGGALTAAHQYGSLIQVGASDATTLEGLDFHCFARRLWRRVGLADLVDSAERRLHIHGLPPAHFLYDVAFLLSSAGNGGDVSVLDS